jgi:hypothetical protein
MRQVRGGRSQATNIVIWVPASNVLKLSKILRTSERTPTARESSRTPTISAKWMDA